MFDFMFFFRKSLQTYKDFTVQKASDCTPSNERFSAKLSNLEVSASNDSFLFSGNIEIFEKLPMNMEVEISITRCNLDGSGCAFFDKIAYSRICEKMNAKTSVAYKIANGIFPHPECPVSVGSYTMLNDSKYSFEMFKSLPVEGYLWRTRNTFFEKKGNKRVKKLACIEYDVAVMNKVVRRTKQKN